MLRRKRGGQAGLSGGAGIGRTHHEHIKELTSHAASISGPQKLPSCANRCRRKNLTASARSPGWEHGSGSRAHLVPGKQLPGFSGRTHCVIAARFGGSRLGDTPIAIEPTPAGHAARRGHSAAKLHRLARQRSVPAITEARSSGEQCSCGSWSRGGGRYSGRAVAAFFVELATREHLPPATMAPV